MDWNSKLPLWDFSSDLEQNTELNMGPLVGPSYVLGSQSTGVNCSVDLKLGGLGDFRPPEKWKSQPSMSPAAASSAPSRRARAGPGSGGGGQMASCSVDGCKSDLSNSREYHRRHKVCEVHSKTPVVMVGGQEQRFCQQCSRFHQLVEFDEVKRSCRKRLDGHNRRRRKPQMESTNSRSLFHNNQGSKFLMYPHVIPTDFMQEHSWSGIIKTEDRAYTNHLPLHVLDSQQRFPATSLCSNENMIKHLPFLQEDTTTITQSGLQPFLKTNPSPSSRSSSGSGRILPSDCALSLLSSAAAQNPGVVDAGQMLPAGRIPLRQSLVPSHPCTAIAIDQVSGCQASSYVSAARFACLGVEDGRNVIVCDADAGLRCHTMFNVVGEGSSEEASQALPFSWH
ncbi:squamosa promoter-binding-like protein 16 [Canna indica]|uniref:Squamosa promoter-binding-like protein 16 n=1 Tax=Canna indica TaxID=4628 RepID=A0AAQ3KPW1_9LILI|nr:squamosa promoter-binding-like protein 16 [Canna indica]